jgi:hypothetical protein
MASLVCFILIMLFGCLMVIEHKAVNRGIKKLEVCFVPCKSWRVTWKHGVLFVLMLSCFWAPEALKFFGFSEDVFKEAWTLINVLILVMSLYSYCAFLRIKMAVKVLKIYLEQNQDLDKAVEFTNRACLDGDFFRMVFSNAKGREVNNAQRAL